MRHRHFYQGPGGPWPPPVETPLYASTTAGRRADAVQLYHTGAGYSGVSQILPGRSLGGYRSSTRAGGRGILLVNALPQLIVDFASGANPVGDGILTAVGADELTWCAPGGSAGSAVSIDPGEQQLLTDGDDPNRYVLVTRIGELDLEGACTVQLVESLNNAIAHANDDIETGPTYRCLGVLAGPDGTVENLKIWIAQNEHPLAIALESPTAQPSGLVQQLGNETDTPSGLTFVEPDAIDHADVLTVPSLAAGQWRALWIRRDLSSETDATPWAFSQIAWSFDVVT